MESVDKPTSSKLLAWLEAAALIASLCVLAYYGYLLWGTSFQYSAEQKARADLLAASASVPPRQSDSSRRAGRVLAVPSSFKHGAPVCRMWIPKLRLSTVVAEGTDTTTLKGGPGHYVGTALPGQLGNVVVSGHRVTYGAPFRNLHLLKRGDSIVLTAAWGRFTYRVYGLLSVLPTQTSVLRNTGRPILMLTTCNPAYSARERLVVFARLVGSRAVRLKPQSGRRLVSARRV